jgi:polyhydroxyalkanoate synthesis regulator phasin
MDVFKKAFLAGLGAVSLSQERTKELVEELVKAGKLKEKDGQKLFKEMMAKASVVKKDLEGKVNEQAKQVYAKMNTVAVDQLKKMEKRIQDLEKELSKSGKPTSAAKPKTAKKTTGKSKR